MFHNRDNPMLQLVQKLNYYRDQYYNHNKSEITDKEYDAMFDQLVEWEKVSGVSYSNSPTQTVGYSISSELEKSTHSHPMLSLDKTKSSADLVSFAGNKLCLLTLKMDGLTVCLTYEDGKLVKAETRGNGLVGEDITENAKRFKNIPLVIPYKDHLEVEGEAIVTYKDFQDINKTLSEDEQFKHPRNYASGSVRQLDSKITSQRNITFVAWKVPGEMKIDTPNSLLGRFNELQALGFTVVPALTYIDTADAKNIEEMIKASKFTAKFKGYPIDGLVMTYDDIAYGESLGQTGHHPKHSIAFKFEDEEVISKLINIEWTMGKTGALTPTAVFEPVEIDFTMVEKASLHNVSILESLDLRMGDNISVIKANQIIPQITSNASITEFHRGDKFIVPEFCPYCGEPLSIQQLNESKVLICDNENCNGKKLFKLVQFCSKEGLDIRGLSEGTLEKLIPTYINNPADIFTLSEHINKIINIPGLGSKWGKNILSSIKDASNTTLSRLIVSLSIPDIGVQSAKDISKECSGNIEEFKSHLINKQAFDCLGNVSNSKIKSWSTDANIAQLEEICKFLTFKTENNNNDIKLAGKTFCVTGTVNQYKSRKELISVIESNGGKVSSAVSKNTDYLINNDTESISSKNQKAKVLNIPIISEQEFISLLKEN